LIARPRFGSIALAVTVVATGLDWVSLAYDLNGRYEAQLQQASTEAANLAKAYAAQVHGLVFALDELLQAMRADYMADSEHFQIEQWAQREYSVARNLVVNLSIADAAGLVLQSSVNPHELMNVSISDREHFRVHVDHPGVDRLFISKPVVGRVSLVPSIQLSRPILGPDDDFRGVVVASINPQDLSRFYDSVDVGETGAIALVGEDHVVRARAPSSENAVGLTLPRTVEDLLSPPATAVPNCGLVKDPIDEVPRLNCLARVEDLPLVVAVGLGEDEILEGFRFLRNRALGATAALTIALWAAAFALVSRERHKDEAARIARESAARLTEESARLEAALDNMSQGIVMIGPDRRVKVINGRARELLDLPEALAKPGVSIDQIIDCQWKRGEYGPEGASLDPPLQSYISTRNVGVDDDGSQPYVRRRPNGAWLEVRSNPMPNGGVVRTYADVSELVRAKVAAEAGERAKASFLATMSHEIRTPMNGVIGMIDLIEETPLTAQQRRYVETIRSSGEALVALINDVLDFSKLEAGQVQIERRPFAAIPLAETAFDIIEASAAKTGVALRLFLGPGLGGTFFGDPTRLRQILLNLCGNAVKFTKKGSVELRLTANEAEGNGLRLRFEVADTGVGVPEAMRHRLFREFSQADASVTRKFGGTGLGLAICKRLVEAMGGEIDFTSQEGVGSEFWFEIPAARAEAPNPPVASARARIVSDDARTRAAALSLLPYVGLSAGDDGEAEVALVHASGPEAPPELAEIERNARVRAIVFGLDAWRLAARADAAVDGALTPVRLARALAAAATKRDGAKPADAGAATPAPSVRKLKALVAEDHPISREVLSRILQRMGHETTVAEDGRQAVDRVVEGDFDIVFMDVQMPGMDGLEATRRIRALGGEKARTPIVAMTASAMDSDRAACLEAGMTGYLSKPVGRDKIADALAQIAPRRA